jgi:hypothetical protein
MKNEHEQIPVAWARVLRRMQNRMSWGWFVSELLRLSWGCAGLTGVVWWLLRLQNASPVPAWILGAGCLLAAVFRAGDVADTKWMGAEVALSRLDVGWQMRHQLVSAYAGQASWPDRVPEKPLPVVWLWKKSLPSLGLSLLFLMLAAWTPLPPPKPTRTAHQEEPPDWKALEALAQELSEQELVKKEDAQKLLEDVQTLRDKPRESWYEPSSLEATDQLRERARMDVQRLQSGLAQTAKLMQVASERMQQMNNQNREQLQQRIQELQQNIQQGGMKPGGNLAQKLADLNLDQLQNMDQNQLQQLEELLRQQAQQLQQAMAQAGMPGEEGFPGQPGGVGQGGDPTELSLKDDPSYLQPTVPLGVVGTDPEAVQLGDLLSVREGEHEKDRAEISNQAGNVAQPGGSGEVVWRQDVLPADEKVLQDYFK